MTDPTQQEWLANRLDRLESKMDVRMDRLSNDMKETRHTLRPMIETAVTAVAQQEIITRRIEKDIAGFEEWRRDGGTLDERLRREQDQMRVVMREAVADIKELIADGERRRDLVESERLTEWRAWRVTVDADLQSAKLDRWYRAGGWKAIAVVGGIASAVSGVVGAVVAAIVEGGHHP